MKEKIEALGITCDESTLEMIPKTTIECGDGDKAKNVALVEWLEDLDDVDSVYHNMDE